ncbi:MAG: hypothetical protein MJ174_07540 [Treponema sp.]|nr:hypothetical protein [Treponema sp.]
MYGTNKKISWQLNPDPNKASYVPFYESFIIALDSETISDADFRFAVTEMCNMVFLNKEVSLEDLPDSLKTFFPGAVVSLFNAVHTDEKKSKAGKISAEKRKEKEQQEEAPKTTEKEKKKFIKPTVEELQKYIGENKLNVDVQSFLDYYNGNGWKVGKNPMKDWQATVRRWNRNNLSPPPKETPVVKNIVYENEICPECSRQFIRWDEPKQKFVCDSCLKIFRWEEIKNE